MFLFGRFVFCVMSVCICFCYAVAEDLSRLPLDLVDADLQLSRQAAIYKATHKMAYADCFAAALAKSKNAELVTADTEFKPLEKEIKINWLK